MGGRSVDQDGHLELEDEPQVKMGTPRPPTPAEIAWGEEVAKGLAESAVSDNGPPLKFAAVYEAIRQDERQKNIKEFGEALAELALTGHAALPAEIFDSVRQDERRKAEQEIADWLTWNMGNGWIRCVWMIPAEVSPVSFIREGLYRSAGQQRTPTPPPSPDPVEARGEAGVEEDRASAGQVEGKDEELRPCPFCGERPKVVTYYSNGDRVECYNKECPAWRWDEASSAPTPTEWNTRPIEDRLREELGSAKRMLTAYESAFAWHETNLRGVIERFHRAERNLQQQLSEEKQYNEALEKRLGELVEVRDELAGKLSAEAEANGMHYEGGRQEGWKMCRAAVAARIREHADHAPGHRNILRDLALEIEGGKTIEQVAGAEYDLAFDRAQLRAETEHETASRIADWCEAHSATFIAQQVRRGAWREGGYIFESAPDKRDGEVEEEWHRMEAPSWDKAPGEDEVFPPMFQEEEVFTEELGWVAAESDPGDWQWARHLVCALIRWSLGLEGGRGPDIRGPLVTVLAQIDFELRGKPCASA